MKSYRKPYRVKRRKSILRNRLFWLGTLVILVIGGISYLLFFSGIFQIKKIIITGDKIVSEENIKALFLQNNIFLIDTEKAKKDILRNFSTIAELEIRRGFPDTLNILVAERSPASFWCEAESCFLMDGEGVIFGGAVIASEVEGLIKIAGVKEMLNKEKISQILEIGEKLEKDLDVTTTQALIVSEERLNIRTSEGWEIYFNAKGDLSWQLQELALVLEKQITPEKRRNLEYIDLRFSRVYYK